MIGLFCRNRITDVGLEVLMLRKFWAPAQDYLEDNVRRDSIGGKWWDLLFRFVQMEPFIIVLFYFTQKTAQR